MKRYCMRCGKPATQQRPSLFVCEDGHDNWVNPPVGSVAFILRNQKVLYGVRSREPGKGKLDLVGGMIEIGDNAEQSIIREAKEEVGLDITLLGLLGTYATTYADRPILNVVFIASASTDHVIPGDDMSGGEPVWRALEDLPGPAEAAAEWFADAQKDLLVWLRQNPQSQ